jgi:anthranilate phosphoribosyltransferase
MSSAQRNTPIQHALTSLASGEGLAESLSYEAFDQIMRGEATPAQVGALLMGLRVRGESAAEIAGAVRALRGAMVRVAVPDDAHLIDTCGTGGGKVTTFNISTAAALVAAGAGAVVAKARIPRSAARRTSWKLWAWTSPAMHSARRSSWTGPASRSCSLRHFTPPCGTWPRCAGSWPSPPS